MNKTEKPTISQFSKNRKNIQLFLGEGHRKHKVHAFLELDVTKAKTTIHDLKKQNIDISFTGWLIKCIADSLISHPQLNSHKQGKNHLITYNTVDIAMAIERKTQTETRPLGYILRNADTKKIDEITTEIRTIQQQEIKKDTILLGNTLSPLEQWVTNAPLFLKKIALRILRNSGKRKQKYMGTASVTSIGMKGYFPGWIIPLGGTTTSLFAIGGITKKPGVKNNQIAICDYLHMTITIDHDIVDGGPLARFVDDLTTKIEHGYALP